MAVEKMQFAMPMAAGYEGFPFTPFQAEKEQAEAFVRVRAEPEAAILKAKAKAKAEKEAAILKAKAEKEAAILKAKAEVEKEEGIIKVNCCGSDEDDVPYDMVYHDSDADEDPETIMARIVERWDVFIKEEEARFPDLKYRVYYPGEYTVDDPDDSDDEQYYRRKLEEAGHVLV